MTIFRSFTLISMTSLGIIGLSLTGCATAGAAYDPIIDAPKTQQYYNDLAQCQSLAQQKPIFNGETGQAAAIGAATGAGAAVISDRDKTSDLVESAAIGAAIGGGAGAIKAQNDRKNIVKNCMSGRGYRILG